MFCTSNGTGAGNKIAVICALHKEGSKQKGCGPQKREYERLLALKDVFDGEKYFYAMHSTFASHEQERNRLMRDLRDLKKDGKLMATMSPAEYTKEVVRILTVDYGYWVVGLLFTNNIKI